MAQVVVMVVTSSHNSWSRCHSNLGVICKPWNWVSSSQVWGSTLAHHSPSSSRSQRPEHWLLRPSDLQQHNWGGIMQFAAFMLDTALWIPIATPAEVNHGPLLSANMHSSFLLTLGTHAQRGLQQSSCVCVSVCLSVCNPYFSKPSNKAFYQRF